MLCGLVDANIVTTKTFGLATMSHTQSMVRNALRHNATSPPSCTLLLSPRGSTRSGPTCAASQTSYSHGTFHSARSLILTSVNAQRTLVSLSSRATRQWPPASCAFLRHSTPLFFFSVSRYLCRRSCFGMFLILFPQLSVLMDSTAKAGTVV